ncbi:response regulator [Winogradskyella pulchriflava]|uniref:histidine kinase n=1 Tax=Winogradskyella pulchriflava TaxID=1110688 RepID=A0ABV6QDL4_9FLAO
MNLKGVIIILLMPFFCIGQSQVEIDSLKTLISTSKKIYKEGRLDSAYCYAKRSYHLAKASKADSLQLDIVDLLSNLEPDLEKALSYLSESEPLAIKNKQWKYLEDIYHTRGAIYYFRSHYESALSHFLKLDSLLEVRKDNYFLAAMTKVSIVNVLNDSRTAMDTSHFSQMNKNIEDGLKLIESGLKVSTDSLVFFDVHDLNVPAAILYEKKANIYLERNESKKAIANFKKALSNTIANDNHLRKSSIYDGLANLYNKQGQQDSALHYFKKELVAINKTNDTLLKAITNYKIAGFYNKNNNPKAALNHLIISQNLMKDAYLVREKHKYDIQAILASVHFNLGNYKEAFEASEKARDHLRVIQTDFNKQNISELEKKYQTEKKEQEINLLKSQNETVEQQKKNQRILMLSGIGITTIAGLFLFFLYRNHQKTNTKLKELDALKSNFFTNISHEFRTPLTLISSPIDDVLADNNISVKKRQQFTVAKQNSDRLLELVNQLLDLSKIDAGHLKLHLQQGNVLQLISAFSESFMFQANKKNIDYNIDIAQNDENVWFDKDAVEKITVNLLSNAIKYTPEDGSISCKAYIEKNKLVIKITNSGKGLTDYELNNIFERFYQTNEQNQGTGIGLALVRELVELHKGNIEAKSTSNKKTSFSISLTIDKNSFKNDAIFTASNNKLETEKRDYVYNSIIEDEEFTHSDLPILLIVEDNDDLRNLLRQTFENNYNVIAAPNGKIGLELALEHIPDLIISDIMMPEKDGITLTKELKNDERTAHIPIILLTAKAGVENQFKGIDTGADDYITKPFDKRLLALKVEKLIESRIQLQLRYSQELVLMPKDIAISNIDEKFLKKVQTVFDENLVESSFNVTEFAEAVGMSRMQLHRKLKALTGLTASEFIRSQRLKLAAKLLKSSDINISQVGYSVGFNDHSYFAKCFKEAYNCTPTEFSKRS